MDKLRATDYQLVTDAKKGNNEAIFALYAKFERLIHRYHKQVFCDKEDFMQSAFESLLTAIEKCDLSKGRWSTDPLLIPRWGFIWHYENYLKKLVSKIRREIYCVDIDKVYVEVVGLDSSEGSRSEVWVPISKHSIESTIFQQHIESRKEDFFSSLSAEDREFLEFYAQAKYIGDVSLHYGIRNSEVNQRVRALKAKALKFFDLELAS